VLGIVAAAALLLYWPVLTLPLLFDDLLHIRLVKELNWRTVWLPSTDFGFYRPFVFAPFLVIKQLFGYYPSELLHGLNWVQQAVNGVLLAALAWRLWRRWQRALAAGLLLVAYPFAYQAIAFYGNNIYPLAAGWMLILLHGYLWGRNGRTHLWWLVLLLFVIGLLSHETLVLFGPLAALTQWAATNQFEPRQWRWPRHTAWSTNLRVILRQSPYLLFIALGGVYMLLYQFLPRGGGPTLDYGGNALWPKLLYLLQTAVHPIAWFAHRQPNLAANTLILGGLLLLLGWTGWAARQKQNRWALLLGWGWWLLASLLIGINLPTYYIEHGARLTYLGGVGVALIWAVLLDGLWGVRRIGPWLWALLLVGILLSSASFVRGRLAAFTTIGSPMAVVEDVMEQRPSAEGVLLINLPAWSSPPRNTYAVGVEYVTLMGHHLFAEELVQENMGGNRPVLAVELPDLLRDTGYPYGIHAQGDLAQPLLDWAPDGATVFATTTADTGITTQEVGRILPPADASPAIATFGPYALQDVQTTCTDEQVQATLTWQYMAPPAGTLSMFVQLVDQSGQLMAQADGPPLGVAPALWTLPEGWQVVDQRQLPLPPNSQPGQLLVGVYDYSTGERQTAVAADGSPLADNALQYRIAQCP
jgi:hypothetical protein